MSEILRREIAHLTGRLDGIIREQAGQVLFDHLRQIRQLAMANRQAGDRASLAAKRRLLGRLSEREAYLITHAFSLFFQLVNLCEERARIRHLQSHPKPSMSLRWLFGQLKRAGVAPRRVRQCLEGLEIQPVLTAHPTEAKRRAALNQLHRLEECWEEPEEVMEALWQTEEVREHRVRPLKEVENNVYYLTRTVFETAARFYATFDRELAAHYPSVKRSRAFLTFASWVGGDRDGNPFVTPEVSRAAVQWHTCVTMDHYEREVARLVEEITHASEEPAGGAVRRVDDASLAPYQPYESFRTQLAGLRRRLRSGQARLPEIRRVLQRVQRGLVRQGARRAASGRIARLLLQTEVFGLHAMELDFRDHSGKLESASEELLEEFRTIGIIQKQHGARAANHFILSMTRQAEDILGLLKLARTAGVERIHLVPLFETIQDLDQAPSILGRLWSHRGYRAHLRGMNDVQEVMVGYSDSNKDGGYLAANWFLYRAQKEMAQLARRHRIKLRLFHGKGGTIDRGGGASHRSLRAQPHAAEGGRLRITEQGEVISLKYSNPEVAQRNLEQLTSAVMAVQCLPPAEPVRGQLARWEREMEGLARSAFEFYRQLVYGTPEFGEYFWQATPIDLIEHLRLGSRPTRRQATAELRELRAIPWVFAWTQSRHLLSAWYGVGHALKRCAEGSPDGLARLRDMYAHWPFFKQLLDNAEVSLAKTELSIARHYAALVHSRRVREKIFGLIQAEHRRSVRWVLAVTGKSRLLADQPVLAESIRLRNPHVDPLNFLQIRFLARWRQLEATERTETLRRLLALTVNGIAFGMKSTG